MTKQAFLLCQTMVARLLQISLNFFPWILQFDGGISVSFLKNRKSEKSLNFPFPSLSDILKIYKRK